MFKSILSNCKSFVGKQVIKLGYWFLGSDRAVVECAERYPDRSDNPFKLLVNSLLDNNADLHAISRRLYTNKKILRGLEYYQKENPVATMSTFRALSVNEQRAIIEKAQI